MMYSKIAALAALMAAARAQKSCSLTTETHPSMTWQQCTASGCSQKSGSVVIDANWRWTHSASGTNCYTGNSWDATLCPDSKTCTANCCVDGADYAGTYGAKTSGSELSLQFVKDTPSGGKNIGSRFYLMASDTKYQMFTLLGNEFTFDVDASQLPCGLNGAVYFVSMDEDGGSSKFPDNKAGAKYGTGYCDSQCPRDIKFIDGVANNENWTKSSNDANAGYGAKGACCAEMDIWEANSISTAYTPHPCQNSGYHSCEGDSCGGTYAADRYAGDCDPDGCDFNSYRQGDTKFYGPGAGFTVDTTKKVTVVTQFVKGADGQLSEIRRFYQQGGKTIPNSNSTIAGNPGSSITEDFCAAQKVAFGDTDVFKSKGGLKQMGDAVAKPMVLVMSVWDDHASNMLWLDSTYPVGKTGPGAARGSCGTDSGVPADVEAQHPGATVKYSNIRFGPIGSTTTGGGGGTDPQPEPVTSTRTSTAPGSGPTGAVVPKYGQCGGNGYSGPTTCAAGSTCTKTNEWYSQCL